MTKKMTNQEYVNRVYETVGNEYSILEEYIDTKTKILTRHNTCGNEWYLSPNKFLMGRRCPRCSNERSHNLSRKTIETLNSQLFDIFGNDLELIGGNYKNNSSVMLFHCYVCERDFSCRVGNVLTRERCPLCSSDSANLSKRKTNEKFLLELYDIYNDEYIPLEEYSLSKNHILMKHIICGTEWNVTPSNILRGYGCPKCGLDKRVKSQTKTHDKFLEEVNKFGGGDYIALSKYVNNFEKIYFKHVPCGNVISMTPSNFLRGRRCHYCSASSGEQKVRRFLVSNKIEFCEEYYFDDCKYKNPLWFDFYLPKCNLLIEYQGIQHYEPIEFFGGIKSFNEQVTRDNIKNEYCRKNKIPLLIIPYWEFDNIENILEQTLSN